MGDPKKKGGSKGLTLLGLLLLVVLAAGVAGFLNPELPVVGPLVRTFFKVGAEKLDKSGVYTVKVTSVVLSPEEFSEGENLDIQVTVESVNADGKTRLLWESKQFGARKAKVGKDPLTANWLDRPFDMEWRAGDKLVVKVWDRAGLGSTELCVWEISSGEAFPLKGAHTFEKVKGKTPRPGGTNQIVFEASRKGDLPPAQ
ncbi:MAG: hypothetical protein HS108_02940 [Planctomycetes bacterium]|nr:hypothetical protein [Planctomycetota bacterium]MCL4730116.1 hypothetical protein [Planctomycetota bacterium]